MLASRPYFCDDALNAEQAECREKLARLRAVSDFEFEFQMAQMNRFLDCGIETIFLMPSHKYFYTSSTIIKQVCAYEPERIKDFVPDNVLRLLIERSKS